MEPLKNILEWASNKVKKERKNNYFEKVVRVLPLGLLFDIGPKWIISFEVVLNGFWMCSETDYAKEERTKFRKKILWCWHRQTLISALLFVPLTTLKYLMSFKKKGLLYELSGTVMTNMFHLWPWSKWMSWCSLSQMSSVFRRVG